MKFTREDILNYLDTLVANGVISKQGRGRFVSKVLNQIGTIPELRSPNREAFIKQHDYIAKGTLDIWDSVVKHLYDTEQSENARIKAEQDAIIAANKAKEEAAKREAELNPTFTADEIKSLSAMMDLCGLKSINLKMINQFFKAVGVSGISSGNHAA